jgi:hypothetical protein
MDERSHVTLLLMTPQEQNLTSVVGKMGGVFLSSKHEGLVAQQNGY